MKKNAVIYARYSSSHQREESIEGQIRECEDFARRNDYRVINHYIDRAMSAKTDARPQFQQMILDSSKGLFDYVIVYQLDRFSRNRYDSAVNKAKLKKNGVKLLSAKENITADPAGIILESVLEGMAEYYSAELAQKIKRGMTENALAGRWSSGSVPLGYTKTADKKLEINPDTGPIVREIFERYAAGETIANISAWLNSMHYTTSTGKPFNRSSFHRMLSSKVYIGTLIWDTVTVPDAFPRLVSDVTFEIVQRRLANSKKSAKGSNVMFSSKYALTTKIKCACCNGPMVGMSAKGRHGSIYHYYACQNKRSRRTNCDTGSVPKDDIENAVIDRAAAILSNPDNVNIIAEQALASVSGDENQQLKILEMQQKEYETKIANGIKAIEKGLMSPTIIDNINIWEAELAEIKNDIAKEKLLQNSVLITKQHIAFFLTRFKTMSSDKAKAYILNTLLHEVIVEKQKNGNWTVTVFYNFSDNPQLHNTDTFSIHADSEVFRKTPLWWR